MSMDCWGVVGYGVEVKEDMFDIDKVKLLFEEDESNDEVIYDFYDFWDNCMLQDIMEGLSPLLGYGDSGNMDCGKYLMYFSNNPWFMSEIEKNLTKEDINAEIVKVLLPLLKEEYTEDWILENIDDISVGGAG